MPYWRKPNHTDANPDKIAQRMEDRAFRAEQRDEIHLARSLHSRRLKYRKGNGERERVFARHWMKQRTMLRHLLRQLPQSTKDFTAYDWARYDRPVYVTKREAEVAASVIQWLGSNCGFAFIQEVLNDLGYTIVKKEKRT